MNNGLSHCFNDVLNVRLTLRDLQSPAHSGPGEPIINPNFSPWSGCPYDFFSSSSAWVAIGRIPNFMIGLFWKLV